MHSIVFIPWFEEMTLGLAWRALEWYSKTHVFSALVNGKWQLSITSGVTFINMFMQSFYTRRSQKHKMTDDFSVIFALLGSTVVKASHKMLMKLTLGRSFYTRRS